MKGVDRYKLPVIEQVNHGDEKYNIENEVNNTVAMFFCDR